MVLSMTVASRHSVPNSRVLNGHEVATIAKMLRLIETRGVR
jgi:hypothetical protein